MKLSNKRHRSSILLLNLSLILLLSACAQKNIRLPFLSETVNQERWQASGAFSLKTPDQNLSARFTWQQCGKSYRLRFFSPLGGEVFRLSVTPQLAEASNGSKTFTAESPSQLVSDTLKMDLPLEHLRYWVKGIPNPNYPVQNKQISDDGTLLEQDNWQLKIRSLHARSLPGQFPQVINFEHLSEPFQGKLVLTSWQPLTRSRCDDL